MGPSERASKLKVYVIPAITEHSPPRVRYVDPLRFAAGKWQMGRPDALGPKQVSRTIYRSPESGWQTQRMRAKRERMQIRAISETAEQRLTQAPTEGISYCNRLGVSSLEERRLLGRSTYHYYLGWLD